MHVREKGRSWKYYNEFACNIQSRKIKFTKTYEKKSRLNMLMSAATSENNLDNISKSYYNKFVLFERFILKFNFDKYLIKKMQNDSFFSRITCISVCLTGKI